MVRFTAVLARVPAIKFRKGGLGVGHGTAASAASTAGSCPRPAPAAAASAPLQAQPAAAMSMGSIPDINLPLRYRRRPLSQEEIDHINGGGIV